MTDIADFSILAPVPLAHLQSWVEITNGTEEFVAFGSDKWEFFRSIDEKRNGLSVPVLIYASHVGKPTKDRFIVSWAGWYVGHVNSRMGRHPDGKKHLPPSAEQDSPDFAVFWHVSQLRELTDRHRLPISKIQTIKDGWRKNAPPRGPELVATPSTIEQLL